jgi:HAD superfamily hydrolase (TIGR01450 family)
VRLDQVRGFVLDVDGTLVQRVGEEILAQPGAREVLASIRASGRPLALFTNGSHAAPEALATELRAVGLAVADEELLTPLRSLQSYLRASHRDAGVMLLGNDATRAYLVRAGVPILDGEAVEHADAVFIATPTAVDFVELERAARAVVKGARLLTGSYAPTYAGANGPIFSRGAMVTAALAKASGARPIIVGKPSRAALRTITNQLGLPSDELAVIGDDLGMDIALGRLGGARTILVSSGISGAVEPEQLAERQRPDAIVGSVADLLDWL